MGIIFSCGAGEELNTENVVICSLIVINKQDIKVKELTNMKVTFENMETGEEHELEAGAVGVHGMSHLERMSVIDQLVKELFNPQERKPS